MNEYRTVWEISVLTVLFFLFMLTCLSRHNFSNLIIVAFPIATLRFISLSHLPCFSTSDPRNVKLVTTSISSPSISNLSHLAVVIIFDFFMLKYWPAFSLSLFSLLINFVRSAFFLPSVLCHLHISTCSVSFLLFSLLPFPLPFLPFSLSSLHTG